MATARRQTRLRGRGLGVTEDFASEAAEKSITKLGRIKQLGEEKVAAQTAVAPQVTGTGPAATVAPPATPSAPPPVTPPAAPTLVPDGPWISGSYEGGGDPLGPGDAGYPTGTLAQDAARGSKVANAIGRGLSWGVGLMPGMNIVSNDMRGLNPLADPINRALDFGYHVATADAGDQSDAGALGISDQSQPTLGTQGYFGSTQGLTGTDADAASERGGGGGGGGSIGAPGQVGSMGGGPPSATGDPAGLAGSGVGGGGLK